MFSKKQSYFWRTAFLAILLLVLYSFIPIKETLAQKDPNCPTIYPVNIDGPNGRWDFGEVTPFQSFGHTGEDFLSAEGTPVYAQGNGVVTWTSWWPAGTKPNGHGPTVWIHHPKCGNGNFSTLSAHLKDIQVSVGDKVEQGQLIGYIGDMDVSGAGSGDHTHVALTTCTDPALGSKCGGTWKDPKNFWSGSVPSNQPSENAGGGQSFGGTTSDTSDQNTGGGLVEIPINDETVMLNLPTSDTYEPHAYEIEDQTEVNDLTYVVATPNQKFAVVISEKITLPLHQAYAILSNNHRLLWGWLLVAGFSISIYFSTNKKLFPSALFSLVFVFLMVMVTTSAQASSEIGNAHDEIIVAKLDPEFWSSNIDNVEIKAPKPVEEFAEPKKPDEAENLVKKTQLTTPLQDGLWGYKDHGVLSKVPKNAEPITIIASHYWPPMGGVNCYDFRPTWPNWANKWGGEELKKIHQSQPSYGGGYCWSASTSGNRWEDMTGYCVAMPGNIEFGTKLYAFGKEWEVCDRGGKITKEGDAYWVDFLHPIAPAPYGSYHQAYIVYP